MSMNEFHNINIERALLSSILFDPSIFEDIAAMLSANDFYLQVHKDIFEAMLTCERNELPLDEEFISKELRKKNKFDEDTIIDIISTNAISNFSAYTKEIKEYSIKRSLMSFANEIKEIVSDEAEDSKHSLDLIQQHIYSLSQNSTNKEFRESEEIALKTLEKIKEMKARGNTILTGIDTGFHELNKLSTGFNKGDLIIVAARPAMGKTAIVLNMIQQSLDDDNGVAFFSLEMPGEQLFLRLLSAKTSIPLQRLKVGDLGDEEWSRLSDAATDISNQKLFIDDNGTIDIHHIRSKLRKLKLKNPDIKLAVIDYLQLISSANNKDRHLEVSEISRGLKLLARELEMPIIALSQLNRGLEARADKRPMLSDLRESGAIEQDADLILFVYRDDVYRIREEKEKEKKAKLEGKEYRSNFFEKPTEDAEVIIGKNRNGPTGVANLIFHKQYTRFVDAPKMNYNQVSEKEFNPAKTKLEMPVI